MATEPSSHDEEKPLPHNCDMEIELLGSILVDLGKLPVFPKLRSRWTVIVRPMARYIKRWATSLLVARLPI